MEYPLNIVHFMMYTRNFMKNHWFLDWKAGSSHITGVLDMMSGAHER